MASTRFLTPLERLLEMENMSDRINRLLSDRGRPEHGQEESMSMVNWVPAMDVVETAMEFQIRAELPGVDKRNVKISVEEGVLTISGHREQEREEKGKRFHRVERAYGPFARNLPCPTQSTPPKYRLTSPMGCSRLQCRNPKKRDQRPLK